MVTMITLSLIFPKQMFEIVAGPPLRLWTDRKGGALRPEFDRPLRQTRS